jgi:hypothetical protein
VVKLKSSLRTFYGRHNDLVKGSGLWTKDLFHMSYSQYLSHILFHRIFNKSNTTGVTSETRTLYPFGVHHRLLEVSCSLCPIAFFASVVPCCDVRYDFSVKTMFSSSLLPFVLNGVHALFILFVFMYLCWCPTRFPYHTMFVSFNSNTTDASSGAGNFARYSM